MEYAVKNHVYMIREEGASDFVPMCEEVEVKRVVVYPNGLHELELTLFDKNGDPTKVMLPRSEFEPKKVLETLRGYGFTCNLNKEESEILYSILLDCEQTAPRVHLFNHLGWSINEAGTRCFAGHKLIGVDDKTEFQHLDQLGTVRGSFSDWKNNLPDNVIQNPELTLALALSAAAPILQILKDNAMLEESPIYALVGSSTTGKTTALHLAASVWASPQSLIESGGVTANYLLCRLNNRFGFPLLMDEFTANEEVSSMLYNLASGQEKGRATITSEPKARRRWLTVFLATSEKSFFEASEQTDGLLSRLVELNLQWTDSEETADAVKFFASHYYGTAYVPLVEYIMKTDPMKIVQYFRKKKNEFISKTKVQSEVGQRAAKLYALLMVAAAVAGKAWGLPFEHEALEKLLVDAYLNDEARMGTEDRIYGGIVEYVYSNLSRFPRKSSASYSGFWGYRDKHKGKPCVWIMKNHFEQILKEQKANSYNIKKKLHAKGYMEKFKDRYYDAVMLLDTKHHCYCIYLPVADNLDEQSRKAPSMLLRKED